MAEGARQIRIIVVAGLPNWYKAYDAQTGEKIAEARYERLVKIQVRRACPGCKILPRRD